MSELPLLFLVPPDSTLRVPVSGLDSLDDFCSFGRADFNPSTLSLSLSSMIL